MNFKSIKEMNNEPKKNSLSDAVLSRIDKEAITPCPRWKFWCRYSSVWVLWLMSVLLGAVSVAVIIYALNHARYALFEATHSSWASFLLEIAPYVWIVTLIVMVAVSYYNFRCTKRGYRYSPAQVVLSSVLISALLGYGLYVAGVGYQIDDKLGETMPNYPSMERKEMKMWQMPAEGRLVGAYASTSADAMFVSLIDAHEVLWTINVTELDDADRNLLATGKSVRLLGSTTEATDADFHACGVFPWMYGDNPTVDTLEGERYDFVRRMYDHMETGDRLAALEEELYATSTAESSFMTGLCADIAAVRRMNF